MTSQISVIFDSIRCRDHTNNQIDFINLTHPLMENQKRLLCEKCSLNDYYVNIYNKNEVFDFLENLKNEEKKIQDQFDFYCNLIKEMKVHLDSIEKQLDNKKQMIQQKFQIKPHNALGQFLQKRNQLTLDIIQEMSDELSSLIMQNQNDIKLNIENMSLNNQEQSKFIQEIDFKKLEQMIDALKQFMNQGQSQIKQQQSQIQQQQQQQQQQQSQIKQQQSQIQQQQQMPQSSIKYPINYVQIETKDIGEQLIHDIKFNNRGDIFVVSSNLITNLNCYAQVYSLQNNIFTATQNLDLHQGDVKSICFTSDDNFITACQDKKIRFWKKIEQNKWGLDQELIELKSPANCIELSHSKNYLASGGDYLCFWKKANGKWTYDTECSNQEQKILCLSFNLDDNQLAVGYHDNSIKILEQYDQKWIQKTQIQKQAILISYFNNKDLFGVQRNGYFNYYEYDNEISDYQVVETYLSQQQNNNYVAGFCFEKKLLALSSNQSPNQQGDTHVHLIRENRISESLQKIPCQGDKIFFSKDGNYLAIISNKMLSIYHNDLELY